MRVGRLTTGEEVEEATRHRAIERVIGMMRQNVGGALPLAALADEAHLSAFHFVRVFHRATGITPGAFLTALRLEEAKRLLLTTTMPIYDICFTVGYQSLGSFTTRFTRLVGLPPGRLRRLPERLAALDPRDELRSFAPAVYDAAPGRLVGRVELPELPDLPELPHTPIAVGLFPAAIPQGTGMVGTFIAAPGPFALPLPPDGTYHLMASTITGLDDPLALLLPGARRRVGRAARPLRIIGGHMIGPTSVTLRPMRPLDPPVLSALATSLLGSAARRGCGP